MARPGDIPRTDHTPTPAEDAISSLMRRLVGNPSCRRAGCYGRGQTGIVALPDGTIKMQLCECGRIGTTDFTILLNEIHTHRQLMIDLYRGQVAFRDATIARLQDIESKTLRGTLRGWKETVRSYFAGPGGEQIPATPGDQAVPLKGEVNA